MLVDSFRSDFELSIESNLSFLLDVDSNQRIFDGLTIFLFAHLYDHSMDNTL